MLMFPYIANLLIAMLLGALIGVERQWRQRIAGLRTNVLVVALLSYCLVAQGMKCLNIKRFGQWF